MRNKKRCILSFLFLSFILGISIPLFMSNNRKVKAETITDLTNTTWYLNPSINTNTFAYINFTANNNTYTYFRCYYDDERGIRVIKYDNTTVYGNSWLDNDNYRTIYITGGTDATNSTFISWLQANATQQTPPTPTGTQITYKYWSPYGVITITDNTEYRDNNIEYTVLFNEFNRNYDDTVQTGLIFTGVLTEQEPAWSYIQSINGDGINILYHGETNNINNTMWLEFTPGDTMDTDLYDFMDLWGLWFDDDGPYLVGMNQGYVEGVEHGRALGQADGTQYTGLVTGIFNGLGGLLNIQVFPNITLGLIIGLPLLLGALIIILKILRG